MIESINAGCLFSQTTEDEENEAMEIWIVVKKKNDENAVSLLVVFTNSMVSVWNLNKKCFISTYKMISYKD